jgi:hypothetical protein
MPYYPDKSLPYTRREFAQRGTKRVRYRLLLTLILTLMPQRPYLFRSAFST